MTVSAALVLGGCATDSAPAGPPDASPAAFNGDTAARLAQLRRTRDADAFRPGLLGPGDELQISAEDVDDLKNLTVKVSADNTVTLPVVGTLSVEGLTDHGLADALVARLAKYVKGPQVQVSVKNYFSRDVAVVGAVPKPGLYQLRSRSETLLDFINRAGGLTETVGGRVIFIPALAGHSAALRRQLLAQAAAAARAPDPPPLLTNRPDPAVNANLADEGEKPDSAIPGPTPATAAPAMALAREADPIGIDIGSPSAEAALDIPARPEDVLIVPSGGEVMVQGWVRNPGAYKIAPAMTVVGAITAAGGEMFSSSATLLRAGPGGDKSQQQLNLAAIKATQAPDVLVQSGDVVVVNSSPAGAVPYAFYELFTHFSAGLTPALPVF